MKYDPEYLEQAVTFQNYIRDARPEGTVGVVQEKLVHSALKSPHLYKKKVAEVLEDTDPKYTPKSYHLWEELSKIVNKKK